MAPKKKKVAKKKAANPDVASRFQAFAGFDEFERFKRVLEESASPLRLKYGKKPRIRYWQQELWDAFRESEGLELPDDYESVVALLAPSDAWSVSRDEFLHDPLAAWHRAGGEVPEAWALEAWEEGRVLTSPEHEFLESVSKVGGLGLVHPLLKLVLPRVLAREEVVALYERVRDQAGRAESEWRGEFEALFPAFAR